jgi:hypothetical protein
MLTSPYCQRIIGKGPGSCSRCRSAIEIEAVEIAKSSSKKRINLEYVDGDILISSPKNRMYLSISSHFFFATGVLSQTTPLPRKH